MLYYYVHAHSHTQTHILSPLASSESSSRMGDLDSRKVSCCWMSTDWRDKDRETDRPKQISSQVLLIFIFTIPCNVWKLFSTEKCGDMAPIDSQYPWIKGLGQTFAGYGWDNALETVNSSSSCEWLGLIQFKILKSPAEQSLMALTCPDALLPSSVQSYTYTGHVSV